MNKKLSSHYQHAVVLGLGQTGISMLRFLQARGIKPLAIMDTRSNIANLEEIKIEFEGIPIILGELDESWLKKAQMILISPGVDPRQPALEAARERGVLIVGDVELFAQAVKAPVIAVTGTNGKSTVVTLIGELLAEAGYRVMVAGNIGLPVLECLAEPEPDYYVLELSSFQLESTDNLHCLSAVVLNVTDDHMDRYDQFADYVTAKQRIYRHCEHPVINYDEPLTWRAVEQLAHPVTAYSMQQTTGVESYLSTHGGHTWLTYNKQPLVALDMWALQAKHQVQNALAAIALTRYVPGVDKDCIAKVLSSFTGLSHRCQLVAKSNEVTWYNDSKATNVAAAVAALNSLGDGHPKGVIWIAGGQGKGADFSPLVEPVSKHVKVALLIGEDRQQIAQLIEAHTDVKFVDSMADAIDQAYQLVETGEVVLLSPACASFDMYSGFSQRGDNFCDEVRKNVGQG